MSYYYNEKVSKEIVVLSSYYVPINLFRFSSQETKIYDICKDRDNKNKTCIL